MFAFKEWTLICDALGRGDQSIIIRKGGIAEGRDGFRFKHEEFLLFPTLFHEQVSKLKLPPETRLPAPSPNGEHVITFGAHVEWTADVTDWDRVQGLAPFHLWTEAEIEKRFRQDDQPGVSVAFVRVIHLPEPVRFPDAPKYGGCRSWVEVPDPACGESVPALAENLLRDREQQVRAALGLG